MNTAKDKSRYNESGAIKRLRIRAWFHAVSHASGQSACQLEYQFSLKGEQSARSCIWDKYRRGDIAPRDALVTAVEDRYPATKYWLHSALWQMADHVRIGMAEIRSAYEGLPQLLSSIFVARHATDTTVFWRRPVEADEVCEHLRRFGTVDAFVATLIVVKEAEITQLQYQHSCGVQLARQYLDRFSHHPVLGHVLNQELRAHLESRWTDPGYTEVAEDDYSNVE